MKTAMQELIDELKRVQSMTNMNFVIRIATDLIEKEKEQIIDAFESKIKEYLFAPITSIDKRDGEKYYNQTYNQNK